MRHNKKKGMKLGVNASHTKAMKKSLVCALLANDRIKTTLPRAKAIRSDFDRIVTWAKKGDLASRRLAIAATGDAELVRETFEKAAQGMWADRHGGHTRIFKLGKRKGDNAEVVVIEVAAEPVASKGSSSPAAGSVKKVTKKAAAQKSGEGKKVDAEDAAAHDDTAVAKDGATVEDDSLVQDGATAEGTSDTDTTASERTGEAEAEHTDEAEDTETKAPEPEPKPRDEKAPEASTSSEPAKETEDTAK